jgi:hypothetical protein
VRVTKSSRMALPLIGRHTICDLRPCPTDMSLVSQSRRTMSIILRSERHNDDMFCAALDLFRSQRTSRRLRWCFQITARSDDLHHFGRSDKRAFHLPSILEYPRLASRCRCCKWRDRLKSESIGTLKDLWSIQQVGELLLSLLNHSHYANRPWLASNSRLTVETESSSKILILSLNLSQSLTKDLMNSSSSISLISSSPDFR